MKGGFSGSESSGATSGVRFFTVGERCLDVLCLAYDIVTTKARRQGRGITAFKSRKHPGPASLAISCVTHASDLTALSLNLPM